LSQDTRNPELGEIKSRSKRRADKKIRLQKTREGDRGDGSGHREGRGGKESVSMRGKKSKGKKNADVGGQLCYATSLKTKRAVRAGGKTPDKEFKQRKNREKTTEDSRSGRKSEVVGLRGYLITTSTEKRSKPLGLGRGEKIGVRSRRKQLLNKQGGHETTSTKEAGVQCPASSRNNRLTPLNSGKKRGDVKQGEIRKKQVA